MTEPVRVRFAPSPTGFLHVGGARTALFNWLFARHHQGRLILRIEDTDEARNSPQALAAIFDGLRWLGIDWDEGPDCGGPYGPYRQSERADRYAASLARLIAGGHTYDDQGVIRLRSPKRKVTVHDRICGEITIDRALENDTALRRSDGSYIFHFVNVVDDIDMKVTHVIRGDDHLMNTPKHLEIFEALGAAPPEFAHLPLILNMDGSKMSKRDQGASMDVYRHDGFVPEAVRNFLCLLGWSPKDDRQKLPIDDIIALFDWDHLNRAPAKFDLEKCLWLNGQYLAEMPEDEFVTRATAWLGESPPPAGLAVSGPQLEATLRLLRPKIRHLPELHQHFEMLFDSAAPIESEARERVAARPQTRAVLEDVGRRLAGIPDAGWNRGTIEGAINAAATDAGVKPGAILFPLRVAVTGAGHGADLVPTLELLGRETVVSRLDARVPALYSPP